MKGRSANLPFWPGGFDEVKLKGKDTPDNTVDPKLDLDEDEAKLYEKLFESGKIKMEIFNYC